jgi:hypothetical protein
MSHITQICLALTGLVLAGTAYAAEPADPSARPSAPKNTAAVASHTRMQAAPMPHLSDPPVHLWAPVAPPYSGTAYRDLDGQPETGSDVLAAQSVRPH